MIQNAQNFFRFRFVSRGEKANSLTLLAVQALQWCHPGVRVVVVDANDEPQLKHEQFPNVEIIHIVPRDDSISARIGRGSRKHLFYWRHSPEILMAVPRDTEFTVYMDSDILLMRPMDLLSLVEPLKRGRIGVSVDESMMTYATLLQERSIEMQPVLNFLGVGGPLLQAGLIFSRSEDNEEFYQDFWRLAKIAAAENIIELLPFDDMSLLTILLTQGGKLWQRWLPLGHEWNYITAAGQDPGVFAVGAHYGGFRAKALLLDHLSQFTVPKNPYDAWGSTLGGQVDGRHWFVRGAISGTLEDGFVYYRLVPPFAISWHIPSNNRSVDIDVHSEHGLLGTMLVFIDGNCRFQLKSKGLAHFREDLHLHGGDVVTIIAPPSEGFNADLIVLRRNFHNKDMDESLGST